MAADALDSCVTRPLADMTIMKDERLFALMVSAPSQRDYRKCRDTLLLPSYDTAYMDD